MHQQFYAPNVHLFAYDLKKNKNPYLLYQKCDEILAKLNIAHFNLQQRVDLIKEPERLRVDLLNDEEIGKNDNISLPFDGKVELDDKYIKFEGFAYPLRIQDCYTLNLNIRIPEKDDNNKATEYVDTRLLSHFNPDDCLLIDYINSSLGQTILITAWIPEEKREEFYEYWQMPLDLKNPTQLYLRELAKECLKTFIPDPQKQPPLHREAQLFGSPIYEFGILGDRTPYQHILVWLFCTHESDRKLQKCYQDLIDLFCYRNKIIQSYWDSRQVYKALDITYNQIEQEIDRVEEITKDDNLSEENLQNLQRQLKILAKFASQYTRLMRNLEEQRNIITINTRSYAQKIKEINTKIENDYSSWFGNDLDFLERFIRINCRNFQEQIKANLGYFMPGAGLLDRSISSIRGIVEIEQTRIDRQRQIAEQQERDRLTKAEKNLQNEIQAIGIAIGAGAIVASTSGLITQPWRSLSFFHPLHPFLTALFLSVIVSITAGLVVRRWQKS